MKLKTNKLERESVNLSPEQKTEKREGVILSSEQKAAKT